MNEWNEQGKIKQTDRMAVEKTTASKADRQSDQLIKIDSLADRQTLTKG